MGFKAKLPTSGGGKDEMPISNSAHMAVEMLVLLAAQKTDTPCPTETLAEWINRSVSYTNPLLAQLRAAGLVTAKHGPGGGYCLARPAQLITVADVFRVFDTLDGLYVGPVAPTAPSDSDNAAPSGTDILWEALRSSVVGYLEEVSLADIAHATGDAIMAEGNKETMGFGRVRTSYTRH